MNEDITNRLKEMEEQISKLNSIVLEQNEKLNEKENKIAEQKEQIEEQKRIIEDNESNTLKLIQKMEEIILKESYKCAKGGYAGLLKGSLIYLYALHHHEDAFILFLLLLSGLNDGYVEGIRRKDMITLIRDSNGKGRRFITEKRFDSAIKFLKDNKFIRETGGRNTKTYHINHYIAFQGSFKTIYHNKYSKPDANGVVHILQERKIDSEPEQYYFEKMDKVLRDGDFVIPVGLGTKRMTEESYRRGDYKPLFKLD